jgi:hypothetical protein
MEEPYGTEDGKDLLYIGWQRIRFSTTAQDRLLMGITCNTHAEGARPSVSFEADNIQCTSNNTISGNKDDLPQGAGSP